MTTEAPEEPARVLLALNIPLFLPDIIALRDHSQAEYERFKTMAEAALANVVKWEGMMKS